MVTTVNERREGSQDSENPGCGSFGESHHRDREPVLGQRLQTDRCDYLKLLQMEIELEREEIKEIKVTWSNRRPRPTRRVTRHIAYLPLPSQKRFP